MSLQAILLREYFDSFYLINHDHLFIQTFIYFQKESAKLKQWPGKDLTACEGHNNIFSLLNVYVLQAKLIWLINSVPEGIIKCLINRLQ